MPATRKVFHEELDELSADIIRLAALVSEAVQAGTSALLDFDLQGAEKVISNDTPIDDLMHSIEHRAHDLLARQQPMAVDLRLLVTILRVSHEIERIGDLMVNVAKAARRLYPHELEPKLRGLIDRMRAQATAQLKAATDAFADRDVAKASAVDDMDDVMDELQKELFRAIFASKADDDEAIQRAVQIALIGRYFERIADHAVNFATRVGFMVTGHWPDEPGGVVAAPSRARA